jgi:hypothetical protein
MIGIRGSEYSKVGIEYLIVGMIGLGRLELKSSILNRKLCHLRVKYRLEDKGTKYPISCHPIWNKAEGNVVKEVIYTEDSNYSES